MSNVIYQYWNGKVPSGARASQQNIQQYAKRIGADYRFDHNANYTKGMSKFPQYYDAFRPIHDEEFHQYDKVLFLDMDIFALENIQENVFEQQVNDIGICEEILQPSLRQQNTVAGGINSINDEKWNNTLLKTWNSKLPRDAESRLKVYNSGVVLYTNSGLIKAKTNFIPFNDYIKVIQRQPLCQFYSLDQNYLHAMLFSVDIGHTVLGKEWNTQIHYIGKANEKPRPINDARTIDTKFVHIQLRGADNFDAETLHRVTNLSTNNWNL